MTHSTPEGPPTFYAFEVEITALPLLVCSGRKLKLSGIK